MTGPIPRPKLPYFYTYSKLNCLKNILLTPTHLFIPYMKVSLGGGGGRGRGCLLRRIDDVIMKCRIQERSPRGPGPPYFPGRNKGRIFFFFLTPGPPLIPGCGWTLPRPGSPYREVWTRHCYGSKTVHRLFDWLQQMTNCGKFTFQGSLFSLLLSQIRELLLKWKVRGDCHPSLMDQQTLPQILARIRQQTETRMKH